MRSAALIFSGMLAAGAAWAPASAGNVQRLAANDDLACAAHYTLAAFAIHDLDATAAEYYASRASDAGKRYLALHPGESQQSYTARVTADAQALQQRLTNNSLTPETLVAEIKSCDQDSDSRIVT